MNLVFKTFAKKCYLSLLFNVFLIVLYVFKLSIMHYLYYIMKLGELFKNTPSSV